MGEERKKVYEALVDGATEGYRDRQLYDFVQHAVPGHPARKSSVPRCWRLSDPDLRDHNILSTIYALAIKHRRDTVRSDDDRHDDDPTQLAPSIADVKTTAKAQSGEDLPA